MRHKGVKTEEDDGRLAPPSSLERLCPHEKNRG